jgi:copper homeostasis protein
MARAQSLQRSAEEDLQVRPILEVIALGPGDVAGAEDGGADRLEIVADMESDGLTPSVNTFREIRVETSLPIRVMLRANDTFSTSGSELSRLQGAAYQLGAAGADGFVLGFLGPGGGVDVAATEALAAELGDLPWTFHRAIDHALDYDRAWADVQDLPAVDAVLTAGSARGVTSGLDELCRRVSDDPRAAELAMAGGGLQPDHVPWLARAGIRRFHVGSAVRPSGSWKAYVDAALVRSWRTLVDDAQPIAPPESWSQRA